MPLLWFAVFVDPGHGLLEFLLVIDAKIHTTEYLHQRHVLSTHAEILLQEVGIHNRTRDTHTGIAQTQIALTAHRGHRLGSTGKT